MKNSALLPLPPWQRGEGETRWRFMVPFLNSTAGPVVSCDENENCRFHFTFSCEEFCESITFLEP